MKRLIIFILVAGSIHSIQAQQATSEPKKFSLKEAVSFARQNNADIKNGKLDIETAQKQVNEILANGLPQVNASGSFNNNIQIPTQVLPNFLKPSLVAANPASAANIPDIIEAQFGQKFSATGSITASQLLFDGGFLMGVKASREFVNLSRLNMQRTEIETEVNVSKAYYLALLAKTNINMMESNITTLTKSKQDIEQLYKNGFVEKTELDRLSLQLSNLQLQRDKVADQGRIIEMVLKLQMGMNVNEPIVLTDNLDELYKSAVASTPIPDSKTAYSNRIEYQMMEQQYKLHNLNKKRYQFGYAPSFAGFISHQQNSFGQSFGELGKTWYPGTVWGLNLSIPVFDGLRKSSQIQQANIKLKQTENTMQLMENLIDQQVLQSKLRLERASQQLTIQEKNMELAQEIYNRTKIKFDNGVGSSLELTLSQNDLDDSRTNYLATMYDYFLAQLELKQATGNIK